MSVYVDNMRASYGRMKMCHMVADSMAELMDMADKIGMRREWFQPLSHPHFDVSLTRRAAAVAHGAIQVDRRGLVEAMARHRERWKSDPAEVDAIMRAGAAAGHPAYVQGAQDMSLAGGTAPVAILRAQQGSSKWSS